MKKFFLLFIFLPVITLTAQQTAPVKQWDKLFAENITTVSSTKDGGYIFGGTVSAPYYSDPQIRQANYLIVKTDSAANIQWQLPFGGRGDEYITCVKQTVDGGYILGGTTTSDSPGGSITEISHGRTDIWIVKTDSLGIKEWDHRYGGSDSEGLTDILLMPDGGYIIAGSTYSVMSGDVSQNPSSAERHLYDDDYWILKINAEGIKQSDYRFGGDSDDRLISIIQTADNGFMLCGFTSSDKSGDVSDPMPNRSDLASYNSDIWVVKIDAQFKKQWDKRFGAGDDENPKSIMQTKDGGYIIGGIVFPGRMKNIPQYTNGAADFWVIKIDSAGKKQWDHFYGGNQNEILAGMIAVRNDGYILAGATYSDQGGSVTGSPHGKQDAWLIRIDANGKKIWDKRIGGTNTEDLYQILQTKDLGFLLLGYTESDKCEDISQQKQGTWQIWLVKLAAEKNK